MSLRVGVAMLCCKTCACAFLKSLKRNVRQLQNKPLCISPKLGSIGVGCGIAVQVASKSVFDFTGAVDELNADVPTVIFAPHFVGLDVGWTLLTLSISKHFTTIFTPQSNPVAGAWMTQGRSRFGKVQLLQRQDGVKTIVSSLRNNAWLYLLPDMNFGPEESIFVPFFGEPAATVPSLSRFAKLGRARVLPVVTRMSANGYEVEVLKAWDDFPTDDAQADTALMNQRLETYIQDMPAQYFWVHKRFKTRPEGADPIY
jgi:Kdo2-lipid IVA lauroyltransferase/acyltransferase